MVCAAKLEQRTGDGHGRQGGGDGAGRALRGRLRLIVRKAMHVTIPFLESASHLISKGFQKLLDEAIRCALRQMAGPVAARSGIGVDQAYMLLGHDKDLQITPVIDGKKVFESIICTPPEIAPSPLVPRSISWRNRLPSR